MQRGSMRGPSRSYGCRRESGRRFMACGCLSRRCAPVGIPTRGVWRIYAARLLRKNAPSVFTSRDGFAQLPQLVLDDALVVRSHAQERLLSRRKRLELGIGV